MKRIAKWFGITLASLVSLVLLIGLFGPEPPSKPPKTAVKHPFTVTMKSGAVAQDKVDEALAEFMRTCQPLTSKHWTDVATATATVTDMADYRPIKGHGRTIEIELKISLATQAKTIPVTKEYGVPDGHVLLYSLVGGDKPGIFASKRVSQALCGMVPDQTGRDAFKPVSALAILP